MGRAELALALQQKGEAEVKAIWQQAEEEADRYRQQRQHDVVRQGEDSCRQADRSAMQTCQQVDWQVTRTVRALRLETLQELDQRLWRLACQELGDLDSRRRRQYLQNLLEELPEMAWRSMTVHPDDAELINAKFRDCNVTTDINAGGLTAETEAGQIRVDSTLRKRLEKAWPVLIGTMLAELERELGESR